MEDPRRSRVLGPLEQRVMAQLWSAGALTVGEVEQALNSRASTQLAYTTVLTVLTRLFEKGFLARAKDGRGFRYRSIVDESSVDDVAARRELQRIAARYGEGRIAAFAADLARADPELVRRLHELAERPGAEKDR